MNTVWAFAKFRSKVGARRHGVGVREGSTALTRCRTAPTSLLAGWRAGQQSHPRRRCWLGRAGPSLRRVGIVLGVPSGGVHLALALRCKSLPVTPQAPRRRRGRGLARPGQLRLRDCSAVPASWLPGRRWRRGGGDPALGRPRPVGPRPLPGAGPGDRAPSRPSLSPWAPSPWSHVPTRHGVWQGPPHFSCGVEGPGHEKRWLRQGGEGLSCVWKCVRALRIAEGARPSGMMHASVPEAQSEAPYWRVSSGLRRRGDSFGPRRGVGLALCGICPAAPALHG